MCDRVEKWYWVGSGRWRVCLWVASCVALMEAGLNLANGVGGKGNAHEGWDFLGGM